MPRKGGTPENLVNSRGLRAARRAERRIRLLAWLHDEVWSTPALLQEVLGYERRQSSDRQLKVFLDEREDLIQKLEIPLVPEAEAARRKRVPKMVIFGITMHGLALAQALPVQLDELRAAVAELSQNDQEDMAPRLTALTQLLARPWGERLTPFEPSRVARKMATMYHAIDLQELRLRAEAAGWTDWTTERRLSPERLKELDLEHRPDALVTDPKGRRIAVEYERTLKNPRRYVGIIQRYARGFHAQAFAQLHWVTPHKGALTRPIKAALKPLRDLRFPVGVFDFAEWPPSE